MKTFTLNFSGITAAFASVKVEASSAEEAVAKGHKLLDDYQNGKAELDWQPDVDVDFTILHEIEVVEETIAKPAEDEED